MIPATPDEDCVCTPIEPCYFHSLHGGASVVAAPTLGVQLGLFTGAEVEARWIAFDDAWTCARCGREEASAVMPAPCSCGRAS